MKSFLWVGSSALAFVMKCFPHLLPSYNCLEPGQRAPILLTQGKVDFNSGFPVQGEAPPSVLFSKFKRVISRGRIPNADISFYLVHELTDLAGAEAYDGRQWLGAEKFTMQFPVRVLESIIDSFAVKFEVEVMEDYLRNRWEEHGLPPSPYNRKAPAPSPCKG